MFRSFALACGLLVTAFSSQADAYRNYEEVLNALSALQTMYPDVVQVRDIGTTEHGRTIRAVKISDNPGLDNASEVDVLLVGGHHAREWISVEVPLRIAEYLARTYATDEDTKRLVDGREIWVVPLLNPDGYVWSISDDRLWRKNRRNLPLTFFGVDLNRLKFPTFAL